MAMVPPRSQPFYVGWFFGPSFGSQLVNDWVDTGGGLFGGYRLGWDYSEHWGCQIRLAFGNLPLRDSERAVQAQRAWDDANHLPANHPFRNRFNRRRDATNTLFDIDFLYYPRGHRSVWRPYLMAGLGTAQVRFQDRLSREYDEMVVGMPLAMGLERLLSKRMGVRLEFADNIAFGNDFEALHHLSFTAGVEFRFGGGGGRGRVAYWPWNPGRQYW